MDSHIDTADPWAAAAQDADAKTSVAVEPPLNAAVEGVEPLLGDATEARDEEPTRSGLFGRRKAQTEQDADTAKNGGFSLMSPAPRVMSDDPQFEIVDSEALEVAPDLGLADTIGDPLDEDSEPLLAAPMDDELYPPLEAVEEDGGLGSISSVLNPTSFAKTESIDFDSVSEEIANAVEEAQPTGIFGALSNPGSMADPSNEEVPFEDAPSTESVAEVVAKTEDRLDDIIAEADDSLETFVEASEESLADVLEEQEVDAEQGSTDDVGEAVTSDDESSLDESDDADSEDETGDLVLDQLTDEAADEATSDPESVDAVSIPETLPADPFEVAAEEQAEVVAELPAAEIEVEVEVEADPDADADADADAGSPAIEPVDESTQEVESADATADEEPDMEPQRSTNSSESSFSLTNAPAEPIQGDEGLFVSTGTEEEVQPVVLVTTDTVPGMEMGESCGLVTAVQAAADAASLSSAIEQAHADLSNRASEVGATAVISVSTDINEVQAGFLVIASGTAVLAAN